ncbi:hypothetical protein ACS0TY_035297 [Phlomoides rotata]
MLYLLRKYRCMLGAYYGSVSPQRPICFDVMHYLRMRVSLVLFVTQNRKRYVIFSSNARLRISYGWMFSSGSVFRRFFPQILRRIYSPLVEF